MPASELLLGHIAASLVLPLILDFFGISRVISRECRRQLSERSVAIDRTSPPYFAASASQSV